MANYYVFELSELTKYCTTFFFLLLRVPFLTLEKDADAKIKPGIMPNLARCQEKQNTRLVDYVTGEPLPLLVLGKVIVCFFPRSKMYFIIFARCTRCKTREYEIRATISTLLSVNHLCVCNATVCGVNALSCGINLFT